MAAPRLTLTFTDGSTQEVVFNPRVLVETERKFGGQAPAIEGTLYGAWYKLGRPGYPRADAFDEWMDTVESFDTNDEAEVGPTPPVTPDGS